MIKTRT